MGFNSGFKGLSVHESRPHCYDTVLRYAVTLQVCTYPNESLDVHWLTLVIHFLSICIWIYQVSFCCSYSNICKPSFFFQSFTTFILRFFFDAEISLLPNEVSPVPTVRGVIPPLSLAFFFPLKHPVQLYQ